MLQSTILSLLSAPPFPKQIENEQKPPPALKWILLNTQIIADSVVESHCDFEFNIFAQNKLDKTLCSIESRTLKTQDSNYVQFG